MHATFRFVTVLALTITPAALCPAPLTAQGPSTTTTPSACREAIQQEQYQQFAAAKAQANGSRVDLGPIKAAGAQRAAECAARFDTPTLDPAQLGDLAVLYAQAGKDSLVLRTLERAVSAPGVSDSMRAAEFVTGIQVLLSQGGEASAIRNAERYMARLDSVPGALLQRLVGHSTLQGYYSNFDIDDKLGTNARTLLSLVKQLPAAQQQKAQEIVSGAYSDLASLEVNELRPDSAIAILQRAPAEFPALSLLSQALAADIARYQLIGRKAPPLNADYWINHTPDSLPARLTDGVTIVTFTAHWCHSCRDAYPTLTKLSATEGKRGLHVVFAVNLDGVFEGQQMTPDQEVAANREYYVTHHGFTYPIAIQRSTNTPGFPDPTVPRNADAYMLRALPQFVVIDQTGTIRAVLMGWDPYGRRERALTATVDRLLAKP
jgi:thiol-disulfide isomerase/thioredoxin